MLLGSPARSRTAALFTAVAALLILWLAAGGISRALASPAEDVVLVDGGASDASSDGGTADAMPQIATPVPRIGSLSMRAPAPPVTVVAPPPADDDDDSDDDSEAEDQDDLASEGSHDDDSGETQASSDARCLDPGEVANPLAPLPYADLSDEDLARRLKHDVSALGSMSLGRTNAGALIAGVQMPPGDEWEVINPRESWGTREAIDSIIASVKRVNRVLPGAPRVRIGDLSDEDGGDLSPHLSHQAGRDVDMGWYYLDPTLEWPTRADSHNLDLPRSWAFLRSFLIEGDVQIIFLDHSLQTVLYNYALSAGDDKAWLDRIFQFPSRVCPGIIRHAKGHLNHFHVRFYAPRSQELGRRAYRLLVAAGRVKPALSFARHKCKRGDTLGRLASHYHTTVKAIQHANGLRTTLIRDGKIYRIPSKRGVEYVNEQLRIPPRRIPPFNPHLDERPANGG